METLKQFIKDFSLFIKQCYHIFEKKNRRIILFQNAQRVIVKNRHLSKIVRYLKNKDTFK